MNKQEYMKGYRLSHKKQINEYAIKWRKNNKDKIILAFKKWLSKLDNRKKQRKRNRHSYYKRMAKKEKQ